MERFQRSTAWCIRGYSVLKIRSVLIGSHYRCRSVRSQPKTAQGARFRAQTTRNTVEVTTAQISYCSNPLASLWISLISQHSNISALLQFHNATPHTLQVIPISRSQCHLRLCPEVYEAATQPYPTALTALHPLQIFP